MQSLLNFFLLGTPESVSHRLNSRALHKLLGNVLATSHILFSFFRFEQLFAV